MNKQVFIMLLLIFIIPGAIASNSTIPLSMECDANSLDYDKQARCQLDTKVLMENKGMIDTSDALIIDVLNVTKSYDVQTFRAASFYNFFKYIFWGLYLAVLVYTGYLYLGSAAFPEKRAKASKQMKNIVIIGIVIVALPLIIYETNGFAKSMSAYVQDQINESYFSFSSITPDSVSGFNGNVERNALLESSSSFFIFSSKAYIMSMNVRHIVLLFIIAIAPLVLLMFFSLPTQEYGKFLVYLFFIEQFMPVVAMIVFKFAQVLAPGESGNIALELARLKMLSSALLFVVLLHIVLVALSIFKASFNAKILADLRASEVET